VPVGLSFISSDFLCLRDLERSSTVPVSEPVPLAPDCMPLWPEDSWALRSTSAARAGSVLSRTPGGGGGSAWAKPAVNNADSKDSNKAGTEFFIFDLHTQWGNKKIDKDFFRSILCRNHDQKHDPTANQTEQIRA
jgi:hypothetical protein